MMKQTRAVAILLSAVMLSILLASAVFVAIHADHECDGPITASSASRSASVPIFRRPLRPSP